MRRQNRCGSGGAGEGVSGFGALSRAREMRAGRQGSGTRAQGQGKGKASQAPLLSHGVVSGWAVAAAASSAQRAAALLYIMLGIVGFGRGGGWGGSGQGRGEGRAKGVRPENRGGKMLPPNARGHGGGAQPTAGIWGESCHPTVDDGAVDGGRG